MLKPLTPHNISYLIFWELLELNICHIISTHFFRIPKSGSKPPYRKSMQLTKDFPAALQLQQKQKIVAKNETKFSVASIRLFYVEYLMCCFCTVNKDTPTSIQKPNLMDQICPMGTYQTKSIEPNLPNQNYNKLSWECHTRLSIQFWRQNQPSYR